MPPALPDRYIPDPDVRERFETTIDAPPALVMQVAATFDMQSLPTVRAIIRLREALLGARGGALPLPPLPAPGALRHRRYPDRAAAGRPAGGRAAVAGAGRGVGWRRKLEAARRRALRPPEATRRRQRK
jgi:hypothetical protein